MRNLKKIVAVVLTLAMLLGVVAMTASADAAATVKLIGRTQMENGDSYFVDLQVEGTVGGVQGSITYDATKFDFDGGVTYTEEFKAVNKGLDTQPAVVKAADGVLHYIGVLPEGNAKWFEIELKAKATGTDVLALDKGDLALTASDVDGKATVETSVVVPEKIEIVDGDQVDMAGATIKATADVGKQDIRFTANIKYAGSQKIVEYGVIFLPAQFLPEDVELNCDHATVYGTNSKGNPIKAAIAKATGDDLANNVDLNATLTNSASFNSGALLQVDMVTRAYIKLADGSVIYSNNDSTTPVVVDGYAARSIIGIAKTIAAGIKDTATYSSNHIASATDLQTILDNDATLEDSEETALLTFLKANEALITQ